MGRKTRPAELGRQTRVAKESGEARAQDSAGNIAPKTHPTPPVRQQNVIQGETLRPDPNQGTLVDVLDAVRQLVPHT